MGFRLSYTLKPKSPSPSRFACEGLMNAALKNLTQRTRRRFVEGAEQGVNFSASSAILSALKR